MADDIRMDSHKLIYHPEVVARWQRGENIYPIELEIGLTNACNHRCVFCAVDYTGYTSAKLNKEILLNNLRDLSDRGLKSIIYAGEGEPLLHKDAPEIINRTKAYGIDAAVSTNGVLMTSDVSKACLKSLTWVRFSMAGIREDTYRKIHCCKEGDLQKVLANLEEAVRIKKDQKLSTTLGVQLLMLPENKDELLEMGNELRKIGIDYFTVKPFSQHPQSHHIIQVDYSEMMQLEKDIKGLETDSFKIYYRAHSMEKLRCERGYKQCLALPFMVYIDAQGNLWPCIVFMGKKELSYGNLNEETFCQIWEGQRRKKITEYFMNMDLEKNCRELCRLDEMNRYLDTLKKPGMHVNFI